MKFVYFLLGAFLLFMSYIAMHSRVNDYTTTDSTFALVCAFGAMILLLASLPDIGRRKLIGR
jgi:Trk-type K+ transport system membrane component